MHRAEVRCLGSEKKKRVEDEDNEGAALLQWNFPADERLTSRCFKVSKIETSWKIPPQ
jgi:hypothetical protein